LFQNSGLSLEQAPPISVVLRFFLVGSIFGVVSGFWLFLKGSGVLNPTSFEAQIMTHLLTLGVMLSFMLGALFQMLPVLAGVTIKEPTKRAIYTQYPLIVGVIFLLISFKEGGFYYIFALLFLAIALIPTVTLMLRNLLLIETHSPSSRGMGFALFNLLSLSVLGSLMLAIRLGFDIFDYNAIKFSHINFGLYGWIALLIISVSFQVIEMFYVSAPYPKKVGRYLPFLLTLLLVLYFISALNLKFFTQLFESVIFLILIVYATLTLNRLFKRKRPLADATIRFWQIGMVMLIASSLLSLIDSFRELNYSLYIAFALSVIFAMSYKIVPFLTWFHLNAQGYFNAPMMHEVVSPKYAKLHLYIHILTILLAIVAPFYQELYRAVGVLLIISFTLLGVAIYRAWHKYLDTQANGERFNF